MAVLEYSGVRITRISVVTTYFRDDSDHHSASQHSSTSSPVTLLPPRSTSYTSTFQLAQRRHVYLNYYHYYDHSHEVWLPVSPSSRPNLLVVIDTLPPTHEIPKEEAKIIVIYIFFLSFKLRKQPAQQSIKGCHVLSDSRPSDEFSTTLKRPFLFSLKQCHENATRYQIKNNPTDVADKPLLFAIFQKTNHGEKHEAHTYTYMPIFLGVYNTLRSIHHSGTHFQVCTQVKFYRGIFTPETFFSHYSSI